MTTYGRARGKRPKELTWEELQKLYTDSTHGQKLPLTQAQMQQALDPQYVVAHRSGLGGSQPTEVKRMLQAALDRLTANSTWLTAERKRLMDAEMALEERFTALAR